MSRQTFASPFVMAGMLAWLAGGRMILSSQTRPLGRKVPHIRDSPALHLQCGRMMGRHADGLRMGRVLCL
jgi:hypothetical protein